MRRVLALVGASAGGWLGWVAGSGLNEVAGFVFSMIGAGFGMYVTTRWASRYYS